jgi:predicted nucleic acid-binding protein
MKIVLNTSPIIFLSKVEALRLLADVSDEIYTPTAVVNELHEYTPPSFIEVVTVSATGAAYVQGALGRLHQGELEAIILAQEKMADYVVLDDLLARRKAHSLAIDVIGTVGLLLLLEKRKLLSAEQTWQKMQQLTEQHGMYLAPQLLQQIKTRLLGAH